MGDEELLHFLASILPSSDLSSLGRVPPQTVLTDFSDHSSAEGADLSQQKVKMRGDDKATWRSYYEPHHLRPSL
jgi:hypothetical protein